MSPKTPAKATNENVVPTTSIATPPNEPLPQPEVPPAEHGPVEEPSPAPQVAVERGSAAVLPSWLTSGNRQDGIAGESGQTTPVPQRSAKSSKMPRVPPRETDLVARLFSDGEAGGDPSARVYLGFTPPQQKAMSIGPYKRGWWNRIFHKAFTCTGPPRCGF